MLDGLRVRADGVFWPQFYATTHVHPSSGSKALSEQDGKHLKFGGSTRDVTRQVTVSTSCSATTVRLVE